MKKALAILGLLAALSAHAFFISIGGGGGGAGLTSIDNIIATNVALQGQFSGTLSGTFSGQAYYTNTSFATNNNPDNSTVLFTVADSTTGATLNFAANVQGGLGDAGAGFFAGENIIWTNTAGMVNSFNVLSNGVFYGHPSEQPLNNGTGLSYYSINCTATETTLFYAQQPIASITVNSYSQGFDADGNFSDLNTRYNGIVRNKFSGNTWYVNDTNGNQYASADGAAFYFGDGSGGSKASVSKSGVFYGDGSGLTNTPGGGGGSVTFTPAQTNALNHAITNDASSYTLKSAGGVQNTFTWNGTSLDLGNGGLIAGNPLSASQIIAGAGGFVGNGGQLTNLPTITSNGITSINPSQIYPAVSANGGKAALATNVVSGMNVTNATLWGIALTNNAPTNYIGNNLFQINSFSANETDLRMGGTNVMQIFGGGLAASVQLPNGNFSIGSGSSQTVINTNGTMFVPTNGANIAGVLMTNGNLSASGIISGNGGGLTNLITTNMLFITSFGNVSIYTNSYWYSLCAPASQSTIENKCSYPSERPFTLVGISIANHVNVLVGAGTNLVVTFRTNAASCASATLVGPITPSGGATNIWFAPITIPAGTQINWQLGFSTGSSSGIGFSGCTKLWGWWN